MADLSIRSGDLYKLARSMQIRPNNGFEYILQVDVHAIIALIQKGKKASIEILCKRTGSKPSEIRRILKSP